MSNSRILNGFVRLWKHVPPVWELPMGEFLAFYDIDLVTVRVITHKPPHKMTEEIV